MRHLVRLVALTLFSVALSSHSMAEHVDESYKPSGFYNFSIFGKYNSFRHGSITGQGIESPLYRSFGGGMAFDLGVYKYMSTGAMLSFDTAKNEAFSLESSSTRLSLFVKPKMTFFDCLTIFSRASAGPGLMFAWPHRSIAMQSPELQEKIKETFPAYDYNPAHFGLHAGASIGLEYSPFSRMSFSLEYGILSDYIFVSRSKFVRDLQLEAMEGNQQIEKASPESYRYFSYEMPLTLSLNMIF